MVNGFKTGKLNNHNAHWSVGQCNEVSDFIEKCKLPSEILRPARGLGDLAHWKGIEYQTFLLYISIVVVKKYFNDPKIFAHFLLYYCSVVICLRHDQCQSNYDVAEAMFNDFLTNFKTLYGIDHFSSNLHNLCHVVDNVRKFGPLDTFSAYPFESKLFFIKNLLRQGNEPLSQMANRISELQNEGVLTKFKKKQLSAIEFKMVMKTIDESDASLMSFLKAQRAALYVDVIFPNFKLSSNKDKDRWILSKKFEVIHVKYIIKPPENQSNVFFYGSVLKNASNYFEYPIRSSELNIYESDCELSAPTFFSL